ncbi:glycosyltransferase family 2 protein [Flavobacterium sp. J27]|uniref:glycosyltransferase family 2 protein n=1 Tax=Flavobacterium sp. J27 TaxID=2060419 RepID=UPI0010315672|nr:glycosyltransferase family 2 protein [Flavobacterium sp. J27]
MNPLVSIITPTFNSAKYIAETITSVQQQSYSFWEMIIVDDGSTDKTESIILSFLKEDKRIQFYKLDKNSGPATARNVGIQKAKGNYIAFLDSDDKWKSEKLEKQLAFMLEHKVPVTFSFYNEIDEEGKSLRRYITSPLEISYLKLFFCNWVGNLTGIYSVDFFGKVPISNIKKRQDWVLWLTLVKKSKVIKPVPESLAFYRVRNNSISSNKLKLVKDNFNIYYKYFNYNAVLSFFFMILFFLNHAIKKLIFVKKTA